MLIFFLHPSTPIVGNYGEQYKNNQVSVSTSLGSCLGLVLPEVIIVIRKIANERKTKIAKSAEI